ncbi:hypothetical protein QS306_13285 [Paraburkholderia bonniea]|uniref:hypothetical protein n=1 Tax=Paraburkholderia bonniea TaxID=2152891 RepID=UPI001291CF32|nr:hypothetical protein [Paraburkholderia bonniea]WJF90053.1 hypothetical protein QS306_13285 [Paraburkholderia bonniea]WJF93367.1 hypothetical protein QS308_13295 [Paraburkholderia bonniea]
MKLHRLAALLPIVYFAAGVAGAVAQPAADVSYSRHPELASAQASIRQAFVQIERAQSANRDRLGDHAENAKRLLDQASWELKAAAEYANGR